MAIRRLARSPRAEVRTLGEPAQPVAVSVREVDADAAVVLQPGERTPRRLDASYETLHVFTSETLEDVPVGKRVVPVEWLAAGVETRVAEARADEAGTHHRLIENAVEVVVRLGQPL